MKNLSPSPALQAVCSYVTEKNYLEGNYEVKNMLAHFFDDRVHFVSLTTVRKDNT